MPKITRAGFVSTRTASSAAVRTPVDCSELSQLHQQPVDAVLRPTFIRKLCYKLPSIVTFIFIQTFDQNFVFYTERRVIFGVRFERRKKLTKSKPT